jgi:DNA-binding NarL/FixJ family response regulator
MLTRRQREVVLLVVKGLPNKEIARRLGITDGTVKVHLRYIYVKLGVRNRTMLAALAFRNPDDLFIAPAQLASVIGGPR